ncbi:ABC1 kinase family protein [Rubellicoccus peritrichatus]|uniref:AarF/UbiB family protein n=1 Tax=Rubellicoccus peritrichatus TaxID=3080537 RepID=A0AAQ3QQE6_9BACT|nr:AarF/UbiB family protein [Puniceicoccus sp. CR14]WOO40163.1 AarF/UbiB family protein [Puniceicoccus sp. CR14]
MATNKEQRSIPKYKLARAASLVTTGAKIGGNYAKYYAKKKITGEASKEELHRVNAEESYSAFSTLKGGPLKVAQLLSVDQNILPPAYQEQFAQAQYSAPPLSYPLVSRTFKQELGKVPDKLFDTFTKSAVNAASIGQVHKATLGDQTYAVKIQYPGVAQSLKSDLRLVKPIAVRILGISAKDIDYYFREVEERLLEETDYRLELKRSIDLSKRTSHLKDIRFPKYFSDHSTRRILTMEWIDGMPLDKWAESDVSQAERDRIGQAMWDFYHFQIHDLREFHADPHPGNFLIKDGLLYVLDFGCVKYLEEDFYQLYFQLLDMNQVLDDSTFVELLQKVGLILPKDNAADRLILKDLYRESIELLSRPFQRETFDFGDPQYVKEIYAFSERTQKDKEIRRINTARGSRHAVYLNRTYYGLYNLLAQMRSNIRAEIPELLRNESRDEVLVS